MKPSGIPEVRAEVKELAAVWEFVLLLVCAVQTLVGVAGRTGGAPRKEFGAVGGSRDLNRPLNAAVEVALAGTVAEAGDAVEGAGLEGASGDCTGGGVGPPV